jgi:beta-N-acetylhexosaminidase
MADVAQIRNLIREIQWHCQIPPFISIDEEGGRVSRLRSTAALRATAIPSARVLARAGESAVEFAYSVIADDLQTLGFNMNYAPVLDLDFYPNEAYLGDRSFGRQAEQVARLGVAAMRSLEAKRIIAVAKHFPGHGRSKGDSHFGVHRVEASREELAEDLYPFEQLIANGLPAILTAHLDYRSLDERGIPGSISDKILTKLARQDMGFSGLLITDAFEMKGLNAASEQTQAALQAVMAGADMIMSPENPQQLHGVLLEAIRNNEQVKASFERSVARIISVKQNYGLYGAVYPQLSDEHAALRIMDNQKKSKLNEYLQ